MIWAMEGRSEFRDFFQNARLDSCEVVEIGCGMFLVTYTFPIIIEKMGNLGSDKILERLAITFPQLLRPTNVHQLLRRKKQ